MNLKMVSMISNLEEQVGGMNTELMKAQQELDSERKDLKNTENKLSKLTLDLEKLKQINVELVESLQDQGKELTQVQAEKYRLETELSKLELLEETVRELRQERGDLQDKLQVSKNNEVERDTAMEKLKSEMESLRRDREELQKVRAENESLKLSKSRVQQLQEEMVEMRKQLELNSAASKQQDKSTEDAKTRAEFEQTLEKWQSRCSKLNTQLTMEKKNVAKYQEQLNVLKSDIDRQVEEKTQSLKNDLDAAKKEAIEYLDKYHALTRSYTVLEKECDELKNTRENSVGGRGAGEELMITQDSIKQEKSAEPESNPGSQPGIKRLRRSDGGVPDTVTKIVEDAAQTPKRKSPRSLSRSKLKAEAAERSRTTPEGKLVGGGQSSSALIGMTTKSSSVNVDNQSNDRKQSVKGFTGNQSNKQLQEKIAISKPFATRSSDNQSVKTVPPSQNRPKGLRPTKTQSSCQSVVSAATVHCDQEGKHSNDVNDSVTKAYTRNLTLSTMMHQAPKIGQSKLETDTKKNALSTITNSPVKTKPSSTIDGVSPRIAGPQRTLSRKKSPHMMRTRRQTKDDSLEQNNSTSEDPGECKSS